MSKATLAATIAAPTAPNGDSNRAVVDALAKSSIYRDYELAFSNLTGLPVALQPLETWQLPYHGKKNENALCSIISEKSGACAVCLQLQERLCSDAASVPKTVTCALGLSESAVPVHLSDRLIGFLRIGQVFRTKPTAKHFEKVAKLAEKWGITTDRTILEKAFYSGKVATPVEHASAIKLLSIFAEHLSKLSIQIFIQQENSELPVITKARTYIHDHMSEEIKLGQIAKAMNMSSFHFCKTFKKSIGINFTEYVTRVRIEKSKNLLLNPNLRISEIAFEVGFQSLTHFNRRFKQIVGRSPTDYRGHLSS